MKSIKYSYLINDKLKKHFDFMNTMREKETDMKVHHLNCTTFNLRFAKTFDGKRSIFDGSLSCVTHCLLIETQNAGLVLIDSGFSIQDAITPGRVSPIFRFTFRPPWAIEETALTNIKMLGYSPKDVRHILLTHLDCDHANGLYDFPWATAHVYNEEMKSALFGKSLQNRLRYNCQRLKQHENWEVYNNNVGDNWNGLKNVCAVKGLGDEFAIVPLPGHSVGHGGILIRANDGWILHAGDAYIMHSELEPAPYGPANTGLFQPIMESDGKSRKESLAQLSQLHQKYGDEVIILCAHDKEEFANNRDIISET